MSICSGSTDEHTLILCLNAFLNQLYQHHIQFKLQSIKLFRILNIFLKKNVRRFKRRAMNLFSKLNFVFTSTHCRKCQGLTQNPLKTIEFVYRYRSCRNCDAIIISNLCEKLHCSEIVAKQIYKKYSPLRSINSIQNDSLRMLRAKLSTLTIVENPLLITMDIGKKFDELFFFLFFEIGQKNILN